MRLCVGMICLVLASLVLSLAGCSSGPPRNPFIRESLGNRLAVIRADARETSEYLRNNVPPNKKSEREDLVKAYDQVVDEYNAAITFIIGEIRGGDPTLSVFEERLIAQIGRAEAARGVLVGAFADALEKSKPQAKSAAAMAMFAGSVRPVASVVDAVFDGFKAADEATKKWWVQQLNDQTLLRYEQLSFPLPRPSR